MQQPAVQRRVRERVMALHRTGERPDREYDDLRGDLNSVAKPQRNLRWREADVLLDVHFRRNGRRVVRRLNRLRAVHGRGEPRRYERLWTQVQELLGDHTVTTHGYGERLARRPARDLWPQVGNVLDALHDIGRPAFVNSGTLLGLVRDGGVIATDDDVDLALLLDADSENDAADEWLELRRSLRRSGLLDIDFDDRVLVHTQAASPDGLKIDLFPGWLSDGHLYLWPYSYGEAAEADVLPLGSLAADGSVEVAIPARPEALLAVNYGDDWRTPDPLFAFDWARAKERFSGFRERVLAGYAPQ